MSLHMLLGEGWARGPSARPGLALPAGRGNAVEGLRTRLGASRGRCPGAALRWGGGEAGGRAPRGGRLSVDTEEGLGGSGPRALLGQETPGSARRPLRGEGPGRGRGGPARWAWAREGGAKRARSTGSPQEWLVQEGGECRPRSQRRSRSAQTCLWTASRRMWPRENLETTTAFCASEFSHFYYVSVLREGSAA